MVAPVSELISFIIPVMNEEESLPELYRQITAEMQRLHRPFEIIFIDDGSTDDSWRVIGELAAGNPEGVLACRFRKNSGKADALAAGFRAARGQILFTLDADLQDDPKEIPRFLAKLGEGFDLVTGWKKTRHDPWHKVLPSRVFNALISRVLDVHLHDHNCGFKCYRAEVAKSVNLYGEMHRMVPALASTHGFRAAEIEVEHHARKFGQSKYGLKRFFRGFMDMQTVYFLKYYRERPLHFFGGIGAIALVLGALLFAASFLPIGDLATARLASLGQIFLMASLPVAGLGFLAEMLLRGQVEKDRRPPIAEVLPARGFLRDETAVSLSRDSASPMLGFDRSKPLDSNSEAGEHILVTDDDPVTRNLLRHHLEEAGYVVAEAENGNDALDQIDDLTAVVLLDLNMVGVNDGLDCLRQIRRRHAHVQVIMVSAQEELEVAVQTIKMGAFDYLLKPARPDALLKTVRKAIHFQEIAAS